MSSTQLFTHFFHPAGLLEPPNSQTIQSVRTAQCEIYIQKQPSPNLPPFNVQGVISVMAFGNAVNSRFPGIPSAATAAAAAALAAAFFSARNTHLNLRNYTRPLRRNRYKWEQNHDSRRRRRQPKNWGLRNQKEKKGLFRNNPLKENGLRGIIDKPHINPIFDARRTDFDE